MLRRFRLVWLLVGFALLASACGSGSAAPGRSLGFYIGKQTGGTFERVVKDCNEQARGRYTIRLEYLPAAADSQREQLVRRLAAKDAAIDIVGLDVIWTPEFAEAGWISPFGPQPAKQVSEGVLPAALKTATYKSQLWAAPFNTNTQLLWYRTDRVPTPPTTWDEMIRAAERLGSNGRIAVQGARYEGLTVWFNSLLSSAGGRILDDQGRVALGPPAIPALEIMRRVARSPAAIPALSNSKEDEVRFAFEGGEATFQLNYSYVYANAQQSNPELFRHMGFAPWPRVRADEPSHVTIGGYNLAVSKFSKHPEEAAEAVTCLRSPQHQKLLAIGAGLPPVTDAVFDEPEVKRAYPFGEVLRQQLRDAAVRPLSPAYNDISRAIQTVLHPPNSIEPQRSAEQLRTTISRVIESGGLL